MIRAIEAPIRARYADEIALDPEIVDEILRTGSNRSKGQLRLIYNFMVEKTPEEYTEFVKNEYGTGGKGFEIGGAKYAVWFDDLGLRIAVGSTAKGGTLVNAFLSWEDVSNRIHELLRQGEYAPQAVLDAARQNALQEHAQTLAYMERDLADGVAEAVFQDTEIFRGGFPELTDRLADLLDDTDFLTDLNDRLSALGEAYAEDKDLMRMHFYKPDKVAALFQQFAKPYQNYSAREGFHWNEYKRFITEDEITAYFTRGSNYSDSRLAIYSFFLNHEDKKERADFLKDHYGIGGSSHALCGADDSHEDHDGRGIALERGPYGNPDASVHLNWNQATGRIDQLIRDSEYLKPADYSRMPAYEQEKMAMRVMSFYHHMPSEVERPYPQDLYHEEGRKALVEKLADPEQAAELLEQMDNALLSVPLDSEEYERKAEFLAVLHQYVDGTYTIFPEKKQAVEIADSELGQLSIFDFMEQEPQAKEQSTAAAVEKTKKDAPLADEKYSEQTLQPLPLDAANEYNALKERYPDALVGYEQYGNFEFYGEDAKRVSELLGSKLLEKETALGKVEVSGFPREQWVSQAMKLWKQGENVYLSGQQEDLYRTSYRLNGECKQAIHEAIADNYDGMHLGDGAVNQVVKQYGMERVGYILANTLRYKNYDDRFSHSNKEWAEQVGTPENNARIIKFRADWVVTSHSAVLDGFVTMYREKLEKQKELEQPFVKQFYVVENRQAVPLEIKRFGNLDDAMSQYQALPNHYMKALGVEKNPDPLPGSLDILQCKNGIDTIVEDYKTVPGWNNPYVQNHVVQPLQGALAVQDVELAYELPDAYFHIQTCEDGFDYTLYNKDFTERDGGILETDGDKPVQEAMMELLAEFGCDAAQGKVMDAAELREQADMVAEQQAEVLKEKLAAERPAPEETLSFYVAECLEFTFAGEFHDHLTMEEALEVYDKIPSERMNADKCIGFCIEEDGGFVGMYELVVNDKVQRENINSINYFRDDKLVQQAISDMEKLMSERQQSKEQERSSTKKSVLDALRSLKSKKQGQPAQEQTKPQKSKKRGDIEL